MRRYLPHGVVATLLAACALPPVADGPAAEDARRAACRAEADRGSVVGEALQVAAQGAVAMAALAWGLGHGSHGARDAAVVGATLSGGGQAADALQRRQRREAACLARKGWVPPPAVPTSPPPLPAPAPPIGTDGYGAARLARERSCAAQPVAVLVEKGPGFERYAIACDGGQLLAVRCAFGHCQALSP